jgi:tryptophan-rich sensory protein
MFLAMGKLHVAAISLSIVPDAERRWISHIRDPTWFLPHEAIAAAIWLLVAITGDSGILSWSPWATRARLGAIVGLIFMVVLRLFRDLSRCPRPDPSPPDTLITSSDEILAFSVCRPSAPHRHRPRR